MLGLKPEEKSKAGAMLVNARLRAEIEAGRVEKIKRGRYRLTGGLS
jgi:hypothetical protein